MPALLRGNPYVDRRSAHFNDFGPRFSRVGSGAQPVASEMRGPVAQHFPFLNPKKGKERNVFKLDVKEFQREFSLKTLLHRSHSFGNVLVQQHTFEPMFFKMFRVCPLVEGPLAYMALMLRAGDPGMRRLRMTLRLPCSLFVNSRYAQIFRRYLHFIVKSYGYITSEAFAHASMKLLPTGEGEIKLQPVPKTQFDVKKAVLYVTTRFEHLDKGKKQEKLWPEKSQTRTDPAVDQLTQARGQLADPQLNVSDAERAAIGRQLNSFAPRPPVGVPEPAVQGGGLPVLPVRDFIEMARFASGAQSAPPIWVQHTPPSYLGGTFGYLMGGAPRTNARNLPGPSEEETRVDLASHGCSIQGGGRLPSSFFATQHNPYRFLGDPSRNVPLPENAGRTWPGQISRPG